MSVLLVPDPVLRGCSENRATVERLMLPTEANFVGNVFGGALLAEVDRVAYIAARRHARANCVTASIDRVDFLAPVHVGEVVQFDARITCVGRTSMEVWVRIRSEPVDGGERHLVGNAYVTMVAVDAAGRPAPVPGLRPETDTEKRMIADGKARMAERLRTRTRVPPDPGPLPRPRGQR